MKRALFLDRDGVVNIEKEYLYKEKDFEFIDGVFTLCKHYQDLGYLIFIVTNQSGIARKYYSEEDFSVLTKWMLDAFKKHEIIITQVYHCPHHPDISGNCTCRKPEPGMIVEAANTFNVDLKHSILVGDNERDIEAGLNAGIGRNYLFSQEDRGNTKAMKRVKKLDEVWMDDVNFK
jgi:D-glycero-D-manno-heptose 1,7-bisphosphate phosphatase